jgi:hypothetical protein
MVGQRKPVFVLLMLRALKIQIQLKIKAMTRVKKYQELNDILQ